MVLLCPILSLDLSFLIYLWEEGGCLELDELSGPFCSDIKESKIYLFEVTKYYLKYELEGLQLTGLMGSGLVGSRSNARKMSFYII